MVLLPPPQPVINAARDSSTSDMARVVGVFILSSLLKPHVETVLTEEFNLRRGHVPKPNLDGVLVTFHGSDTAVARRSEKPLPYTSPWKNNQWVNETEPARIGVLLRSDVRGCQVAIRKRHGPIWESRGGVNSERFKEFQGCGSPYCFNFCSALALMPLRRSTESVVSEGMSSSAFLAF